MSDVKLSEEELRDLRKWAVDYVAPEWPKTTPWLLRLLDEHAAQQKRITALETERDLLRAVAAHVEDGTVYEPPDGTDARVLNQGCWDAVRALAAHDARKGGGER